MLGVCMWYDVIGQKVSYRVYSTGLHVSLANPGKGKGKAVKQIETNESESSRDSLLNNVPLFTIIPIMRDKTTKTEGASKKS